MIETRQNHLSSTSSDEIDPHALGMLLVIFAAAASDGQATNPGGVPGEQWRVALASAAAVVVPLRVFYQHAENVDLVLTAAITLRVLTYCSNGANTPKNDSTYTNNVYEKILDQSS